MRTILLTGAFVAVFIAAASWLYLIIALALWIFIFGDDSGTFGYYALAAAIPIALVLSAAFTVFAVRWRLGSMALTGSIIVSVVLELLFGMAINS